MNHTNDRGLISNIYKELRQMDGARQHHTK